MSTGSATNLTRQKELHELLIFEGNPAVSIYLPLHGHGRDADADRLGLRSALDRARELLSEAHPEETWGPILEGLEPLAESDARWGERSGGLALFLAPGFRRGYRVPRLFEETVVVGPTFHTRPFVDYLTSPQRFFVLELSQKRVQLWEGGPESLEPMPEVRLPRDLVDALGYEFEREPKVVVRRKERLGAHGEHGRGGIMPVFHGHGVGLDDREPELEKFFRRIDVALRSFLKGTSTPLVLATVGENEALYRSISELESLADAAVVANVRYWSPEELHRAAWPLAEQEADKRIDAALELWERAAGGARGETDLANLAHLAVAGRVHLLLTERDRKIWGRLDRSTGRTEVVTEGGGDPAADVVELLDELTEIVLLHGGQVLPVPPERMPVESGAAGILRGNAV